MAESLIALIEETQLDRLLLQIAKQVQVFFLGQPSVCSIGRGMPISRIINDRERVDVLSTPFQNHSVVTYFKM